MEVNKFPFARSCLAGAIALAFLTGCGGGGGGGGGGNGGGGGGGSQPVTVSGAAAKGIIKNGVVSVYRVTNGARGTLLGQGRTSATDGTYSVNVTGYSGPVIVEVTALGASDDGYPSLMVCDIAGDDSCATGVGFGDDYPLGDDFALKAVLPAVSSGQNVTANVTALTDLAASLAESTGVTADSVHIANTQVANLFNLMGDITSLPVVDVTDTAALESADAEAAKAALLSAALLAAAKADGSSIEDATSSVATDFVTNNGQLIQNEVGSTTTTLAEILAQAESLVSSELQDVDALDQIATDIQTEQNAAETAEPGSTTDATPSEENLSDGFLKARALVQDLRDLSTAATFEEIQTGSTAFADNLDVASDLIEADAGRAVEALSTVASAIAEAAEQEAVGPTYEAENGVVVTVATVNSVPTYSFTGDVTVSDDEGDHVFTVSLTGSGVLTVSEEIEETGNGQETWGEEGTAAVTVDFDLVGSVENSAVRLLIKEGSQVTVTGFNETWSESGDGSSEESDGSLSIANLGFDLNVQLAQLQGDAPITFDGAFGVALSGFSSVESSQQQYYNCEYVEEVLTCSGSGSDSSTVDFDTLSLSLSGEFSQNNEAFAAALTINAVNNGYLEVSNESWSHFWRDYEDSQDQYEESYSEETENAFVQVNFTLDMEASLDGISDEVSVRLTGNRNAFRTGTASLRLRYEGKTIDANLALTGSANARAAALTITNNQGAALVVTEANIDDDNDSLSGVINANGAQQATVGEENDIILIRYNGGYVESF